MTDALQKMVEAMWVEFKRQETASPGRAADRFEVPGSGGWGEVYGTFDLEKVARAGLEAIREPTEAQIVAAVADADDEFHFGGGDARECWRVMLAEILKS